MYRRDSGGGGGGRGGKSMENYLPNFSRASNTRMATFHLSFPLNVRTLEILRSLNKKKKEERARRRRRKIKKEEREEKKEKGGGARE